MSRTIVLIPARGASKRIPAKNIRLLNGKPLIQYSIEAAFLAKEIEAVFVSTDDQKIAKIAANLGAQVIIRPKKLASATATTLSVIRHCLKSLSKTGDRVDYLVLLQPTAPFRDPQKIDKAVRLLKNTGCDSVVSLIKVDYFHPNRMKKIINNQVVPYAEKEIENISRDKLPSAYYRDGAIYAMRVKLPLEENTIFGGEVRAIINDRKYFVNIDDENDWLLAEALALRYKL